MIGSAYQKRKLCSWTARADRRSVARMDDPPTASGGCPARGVAAEFDPWDLANPFELYARARSEAPVFYSDELGYWVVSRYDDIQAIFKDPATFSSENTQAPYRERDPEIQRILDDAGVSSGSGLSARQPPDHTRLRRFIQKAFTPRRVAALEPEVRSLTVELVERMRAAGRGDLVADLANHLPALVIFRLLGAPDIDVEQAKRWALSRVYLNFGDLPVEQQAEHARSLADYGRFCAGLVEASFEEPKDDLPGDLARIYLDGDESLSKDEIVGLVYTQLFAGHETTTSLLGSGLKELLEQRERWQELCDDPGLIPAAVEEMLRLGPAVFTWKRVTTAATRVGETDLPEGANILLLLGSANRDEHVFAEPDRVDLQRENARSHLSFGHGIHFCLGASLARLEIQTVLEELTSRLPGLRLSDGQTFSYRRNTTFRGPVSLLVEWDDPEPRLLMDLRDCSRDDVALVGGKAIGLGALMAAGLPVPAGFAVTTHAYAAALETTRGRRAPRGRARDRRATMISPRWMPLPRAPESWWSRSPSPRPCAPPSPPRTRRSATTSPSRCDRAPRPRTPPTRASRDSRTRISGSSARPRCSPPCGAAGPACSRPARSRTGASAESPAPMCSWAS